MLLCLQIYSSIIGGNQINLMCVNTIRFNFVDQSWEIIYTPQLPFSKLDG